ncbi:2'-5' RNA ligase family protein [Micromonospora fulviviridis]|uniref:2'-5' RNA ligase family protein n=1 Tax=Micromonospora fulviviridis TaxID=47860 RepID=UPI003570C79A
MGFTDETSEQTLTSIVEEAGKQLGQLPAVEVAFRDIIVADKAIVMPAEPGEAVQQLRAATRTAIGRVVGKDQVPEDPRRYRPHVSIAYLTADGPAAPYIRAIEATNPHPATVRVSHVDLIEMHRDRRMYEWKVVSRFLLKGPVKVP